MFVQRWNLGELVGGGGQRHKILADRENEANSNELIPHNCISLRFDWHSSKGCDRPTLGPLFLEKVVSLWDPCSCGPGPPAGVAPLGVGVAARSCWTEVVLV